MKVLLCKETFFVKFEVGTVPTYIDTEMKYGEVPLNKCNSIVSRRNYYSTGLGIEIMRDKEDLTACHS